MNAANNHELTRNARNLRKTMTKEERHLWYDCLKQLPVSKTAAQFFVIPTQT